MTLEQKVGQMVQADIRSVTPDDVRKYRLGSVLNGGGAFPGENKHASVADWVALADRFYDASMDTANGALGDSDHLGHGRRARPQQRDRRDACFRTTSASAPRTIPS